MIEELTTDELSTEEREMARDLWDLLSDTTRTAEGARAWKAAPPKVCDAIDEATLQVGRDQMSHNPFDS